MARIRVAIELLPYFLQSCPVRVHGYSLTEHGWYAVVIELPAVEHDEPLYCMIKRETGGDVWSFYRDLPGQSMAGDPVFTTKSPVQWPFGKGEPKTNV